MEVSATLKYINVSPQKCRLVIDLIRGDNVSEAIDKLNYSKQKSAAIVKKVLESAIAECHKSGGIAAFIDAEHAFDRFYAEKLGVDISELIISCLL